MGKNTNYYINKQNKLKGLSHENKVGIVINLSIALIKGWMDTILILLKGTLHNLQQIFQPTFGTAITFCLYNARCDYILYHVTVHLYSYTGIR